MSLFTIYRASAGSGKTYSLVIEYLTLALEDNSGKAYRKILGVTFTNKAATELKERILKFLKGVCVSENDKNHLPDVAALLCQKLGIDSKELAKRASATYTDILHNYSRLSISTIDKFVHRLIRSFARELQLEGDFEIELDVTRVFEEISRQLINQAGKDQEMTDWIIRWLLSRLEEGKGAGNYEKELAEFASLLSTDEAADFKPVLLNLDTAKLDAVEKKTKEIIEHFDKEWDTLAKAALQLIQNAGLGADQLSGKSRGIVPFFVKQTERKNAPVSISSTITKYFDEGKLTSEKGEIAARVSAISDRLTEIFQRMCWHLENYGSAYHFALILKKQLYLTAFAARMETLLKAYQQEKNLVLISDFNKKIAEVVVNEPAPFIYELLGERYHHFLIDEFQDTSILQWQNFLPLVDNSLSKGGKTLVVGDGKQSIYRFRGGEVEQFQQLPNIFKAPENAVFQQYKQSLKRNANIITIPDNYRSSQAVVRFNNRFTQSMTAFLNTDFAPVFADGEQQSTRQEQGYVYVKSTEKEEKPNGIEEIHFAQLLGDIKRVLDAGYEYKDCCILVNKNDWGSQAAQFLIENGIPILSEDSLFVMQSQKTRLILGCFQLLHDRTSNPGMLNVISNAISLGLMKHHEFDAFQTYCPEHRTRKERKLICRVDQLFSDLGISTPLAQLHTQNLYSLAENFCRSLGFMDSYDPFIQFFLDETLNRMHKDGNHLSLFLDWWEDRGQKAKVVLPDGINAVRIMTIHKSKGLEFSNVFIPLVCWPNMATKKMLWVKPSEAFMPLEATLVPNSETALKDTGYELLHENEDQKDKLDDANKLYVALTRAASNLFVYTDKISRNGPNSVCNHFFDWITRQPEFSVENQSLEIGQFTTHEKKVEKPENKLVLTEFISNYDEQKLILGYQAPIRWDNEHLISAKEIGNTLHYLLSKVNDLSNLDNQLDQFVNNGELSPDLYAEIRTKLEKIVRTAQDKGWMGAHLQARNEMELLYVHGDQREILRPDRVVFHPDTTLVIDYKTGGRKQEHIRQVEKYLSALKSMTFPSPKGLLIYIETGIELPVEI